MKRAIKLSLNFSTQKKRKAINALLQSYRAAVNFYIKSLWNNKGKLDKNTLARLSSSNTRLSERYKSQALKQAIETVVSTRKAAKAMKKRVECPVFKGSVTLDSKFVSVEHGRRSFDLVVRLSCLKKGKKLTLPTKKTKVFNKWMSFPNAKVLQGCSLSENSLAVWIEIPDSPPKQGASLGVDIGINKLIATSDGEKFGEDFKALRDKINRKKPKSKAKQKALRERDNFIHREINKLPWSIIGFLAVEKLKGLKKGKKKGKGKSFRKALIPWTYRQVIEVLQQKAQENRVHLEMVEPAYTSQTCPSCGTVSKDNRNAEDFECIYCHYHNDADVVGALNVLHKALGLEGSLESPLLLKAV